MLQERLAANRRFTSTLQQLFVETFRDRPEKTAIVFQERSISFHELQENVNRLSQALIDLGVCRGDHVVSLPTACPEFTYLYFATLQIGALINPLNLLWGVTEFTGILARNDPKVIVTIDSNRGRVYVQLLRDSIPDLELRDGTALSRSIPTLIKDVTTGEKLPPDRQGEICYKSPFLFAGRAGRRAGEGAAGASEGEPDGDPWRLCRRA